MHHILTIIILLQNITLNDLLDKTKFLYDQREVVLKAIHRIQPDFQPQYTPPILDYNCPLLEKITLDRPENRQGLLTSPAKDLLSLEEMIQKGKEQLNIEIKGDVEINNIAIKDEQSESMKFCVSIFNVMKQFIMSFGPLCLC